MRRRLLVLVACFGCRQVFGLESPQLEDATTIDAEPVGPVCLGTGNFIVCVSSTVPPSLDVAGDMLVDTRGCDIVDSAHTDWCILAAEDVHIGARLRAIGSNPLVVVALHDLTLSSLGVIDVSSGATGGVTVNGGQGAGANSASCAPGVAGSPSVNGGGGGAGGSFGTKGGGGGKGDIGTVSGGTAAGVGPGSDLTSVLRGGCAGTSGGTGGFGSSAPPGGAGGGAVYLVAGNTLHLGGTVDASGAGGAAGIASKGGGGGGGSGGMVALWAAALTQPSAGETPGSIFANGGGGGGGADNGAGGGFGAAPTSYAAGGLGGLGGGATSCSSGPGCGGDGAGAMTTAQNGVADTTGAGGGGGGGGVGVIHIVSGQSLTGNISPGPR